MLIFLFSIGNDFNKTRPDFATIQRMMAEARTLKTSSSTYKKQIEDLVTSSKKFQPVGDEEEEKEVQAFLLKKGKQVARPSTKGHTMARTITH